jgi:hypothetical protein
MSRRVKASITVVLAGALFSAGLIVSGMTDPAKVQAFLDFAGAWDPSLMVVMAGAVGVYFVAHRFALRYAAPPSPSAPPRAIDARLLVGASLFGVGWGLSGLCPGPALVSVGAGAISAVAFVAAMIAGMLLHRAVAARGARAEDG